jgi:hypothetical protein
MIDKIIDFENGMLSEVEEISLFSELVKTGLVWDIQGYYGRYAYKLIANKVLDTNGKILIDINDIN